MKKVLLIALALIMVLAPIARAEGQEAPMAEAQKSFQPFELDGEEAKIGGYLINANNYYKLRDLAALLNGTDKQFNIVFDDVKKQIALELGKPYEKLDTDLQEMKHDKTKAKMVTNTILVDGKEVELKAALIDRNNYVKLRDLGPVVGFIVDYNRETKAIIVDTKSEAKAEEKAEDKKEEKAEDKKPEEKKVEKKDQVKTTDPNLTPEEIAKLIKTPRNDGSLDFSDYEVIMQDDSYYLYTELKEGPVMMPIVKYELSDKTDFDKKAAEQIEVFEKSETINLTCDRNVGLYFINADKMSQKSIDILSIVEDFGYRINKGNKLVLDTLKGFLVMPQSGDKGGVVIGYIAVYAKYSDGSEIQSTQEKPVMEIPLFNGKAKLTNLNITVFTDGDNKQFGVVTVK